MMGAMIAPVPSPVLTITHRPPAPLAAFVDLLWYRRGRQPDSRRNRALPTGNVDLVFDLDDHGLRVFADDRMRNATHARGAIVHGPQSRYFVLEARSDVHVLGVHFHPGAGALLLGTPARALADRHVALEDLWGCAARELRERLLEAATPGAMFALLERELLDRLYRVPRVNPAISFALRGIRAAPSGVRVRRIAASHRLQFAAVPCALRRQRRPGARRCMAASSVSRAWSRRRHRCRAPTGRNSPARTVTTINRTSCANFAN